MATASAAGSAAAADGPASAAELADGGDPSALQPLDVALERLGHFGLYQRLALLLLCLPSAIAAMHSLNYVFVADQVPFRCVVPDCEGPLPVFADSPPLPADRCSRFEPLQPVTGSEDYNCSMELFHPNNTIPCETFVYENRETIFVEFGLACRPWLRTLVGSSRNAALPLALLLAGFVSDRFGRLRALAALSSCAGALGVLRSFAPSYVTYVALEFLEAALGYGFNSAAYVLLLELARPSLRAAFASATGVAYGLGGVLLALLARALQDWRALLRAIYVPALMLPMMMLLLDESPRWLHARGRRRSAVGVVRRVASWNKVILNEDLMKAVESASDSTKTSTASANPWLELICSRVLLARFLVCSWCWVAATFVYYGLTINSVSLAGDKYVNFALNMAMEVAASLLLMMALESFGRKNTICSAFLLCGVACITPYFISHSGTGLGMFFVGKLGVTCAFNALYVFTAELFPTPTRASALSACSLVGRLGAVLAPQTPLLSASWQTTLFAGAALLAALGARLLPVPETRRARLPSSALQAERLQAPTTPAPEPDPRQTPAGPRVLSADLA